MMKSLSTGIKYVKNVTLYNFGKGAFLDYQNTISHLGIDKGGYKIFFIDCFFKDIDEVVSTFKSSHGDMLFFVPTKDEPTTDYIDQLIKTIRDQKGTQNPDFIVGMGGGITLDASKAVSNLLTNEGSSQDFQGWDLVKQKGITKIGIPTVSGTGSEATRTCVMTNKKNGLKLGMNSDYTVFDYLILDPELTKTVPREQYFYTGMDAYIHSMESLCGTYRNAIGDSFAKETIRLCREVFLSDDMKSDINREKLMVASYMGGCAIATSYVGLVHPFSAGLSVTLGTHHCLANCISMRSMEEFYPKHFDEFFSMAEKQNVEIRSGLCNNLTNEQYEKLFQSTIIHEKPLINALGENFKETLSQTKVKETFMRM